MSGVEIKTVTPDEAGMRLDRWFKAQYPNLPFGRLAKLMRTGQVRLNGKRTKGADRLQTGDEIRIPPIKAGSQPQKPRPLKKEEKNEIQSLVIYRDPDFMVLNKPSGLAVQGGSKTTDHVDRLLPALQGPRDKTPPRLVHRLDKDTSGLLLVARNAQAARFFTRAFREKSVQKIYWAVVLGVPNPLEGVISAPLGKARGPKKEIMMVAKEGKPARTEYRVLDQAGEEVSWVTLRPVTGRTHQLRVHMAHIGHPILGDGKYGGQDKRFREPSGKLHLHAAGLSFPLPGGGRTEITAPLSDHMKRTFEFFGFEPALGKPMFADFRK